MHSVTVPDQDVLSVAGWEAWLPTVKGTENAERAAQWVNLFRYHRQTQIVSNASAWLHLQSAGAEAGEHATASATSAEGASAVVSGVGDRNGRGGCKPVTAKAVCYSVRRRFLSHTEPHVSTSFKNDPFAKTGSGQT